MNTQTHIEQDYIEYLKSRNCTARTITNKQFYTSQFFAWLQRKGMHLHDCQYSDMLDFIKEVRKEGFSIDHESRYVNAIRQLYASEIINGRMTTNPVGSIVIKGRVKRLPHNLLTPEQLQTIYHSYTPQTDYQLRNKVILGLYINQGLMRTDINRLEIQDINLMKGTIRIRKNIKLSERTLPLAAYQVLILNDYISRVRPQLLKQSEYQKGDRLFFTYANGQTMNECLRKLIEGLRKKNTGLQTFSQIRSSVLSQWVKEKPIREAQYMAGHSSIVSTQQYQDVNLQDLQASLSEYHPLK
jgi:integrase/recombinase XerD